MRLVYFDSSIFLAIFNGEKACADIRALLKELRQENSKICTSIITIQEVSVLSFRAGVTVQDNHSKVSRMARIQGITKEVAMTAAKIEAQMIDRALRESSQEPKSQRRKWDCFHLATALTLRCDCLYTLDNGLLGCQDIIGQSGMRLSEPKPKAYPLFPETSQVQLQ